MKNYYSVLNIDINSTQEQIKKAYKLHASKFHPDKHGGDDFFNDRFIEVQEAYTILSDFNKKTNYDALLQDFLNPPRAKAQSTSKSEPKSSKTVNNQHSQSSADVDKRIYWVQEWFNKGNWQKALEEIEVAIKLYPKESYLYHIKADIYRSINLPGNALRFYKIAYKKGAEDSKAAIIELETLKSNSEEKYKQILYKGALLHVILAIIIRARPEDYDKFGYSMLVVFVIFFVWLGYLKSSIYLIPKEGQHILNASGTINLLILASVAAFIIIPFLI